MYQGEINQAHLDEHLMEVLETDIACERVIDMISEKVPNRFPGQLLVCVANSTAEPLDPDATIDAATAVELAWLHQYLHAIPFAQGSLQPPAAHSAYTDHPVAAILDGDLLQAYAFDRLSTAIDDPEMAGECYRSLSRGSIECYERLATTSAGPDTTTFAPIVGVAARIGALLGGVNPTANDVVERSAHSIATAVPVQTPSGRDTGLARTPNIETAVQELCDAIAVSGAGVSSVDRLINRALVSDKD